jgi:DNA repair exonuclease SbcCD ATPase subunit
MKIKTIDLSWFRGSADSILLDTKGKSVVIYGENGAGKSSFVDAIEYALNKGRIAHLAHEFSGKNQEKAIHNVNKPDREKTKFEITFENNTNLVIEIENNGKFTFNGTSQGVIDKWNYRKTVLRQNEVSEFVHDTKGEKYSTLLPLFGLDELINISENIHELIKATESKSDLKVKESQIAQTIAQREKLFGSATDQDITQRIKELYFLYSQNAQDNIVISSQISEIEQEIISRIEHNSYEIEKHGFLKKIGDLELRQHIELVRQANSKIAENIDPLITEKIEVLKSTSAFTEKMKADQDIVCPACGRAIKFDTLHSHIQSEQGKLREIIKFNNSRKLALESLYDDLKIFKETLKKEHLNGWQNSLSAKHGIGIEYLENLDVQKVRVVCNETILSKLEEFLLPIIDTAISETEKSTPDTKKLFQDKEMIDGVKNILNTDALKMEIDRIESVLSFLKVLEHSFRTSLIEKIKSLIADISTDMRTMWGILHPKEKITDISLYVPEDEEKALDICMKFHGSDQPSARNTLSEGYRNSLGLSIFLSMAKRGNDSHPLFLDDVIVSLDRNHRGMVVELLEKEFSDRQIFIFTHDRVWYTELRHQLDDKKWEFRTLLPYETPDIGIRWSYRTSTFGDARSSLKNRADTAGNDARKIMDIELALTAEKLEINFPFVRGEKNDMRMAHEFLERMASVGAKKFQKRKEAAGEYEAYSDAVQAFKDADKLIVSWANRGSHSFDLVKPEAEKLINACEKALEIFRCPSCQKNVWFVTGNEFVQCQCSTLRWKL